ncbi:protein NipSnap homolog 3A [Eurytemora carolleeae]|uniref:protein NipSnap homolog 3A n=1 Tax=Eurytemora carolleeae TaxID=1294199 RepID=UPI000C793C78|nr:protein NipSnap homolog 3A [Eurytemora carolleeae]|eukprot:XP_023335175.1 protein NipSnap homolog 3A-like [Eurytemora affinis]
MFTKMAVRGFKRVNWVSREVVGRIEPWSRSFSSTGKLQEKIYELRTYNLIPQKVGEFLALSKDKFHLRTSHSVLLGYWTTELGGLNQVVHLWEYGSLNERAEVRAKLGQDQDWQNQYFQKILPMLQNQDNVTLKSLTEPAAPGPDTSGVYELWNLEMKTNPEDWIKLLRDSSQELESESRSLQGVFQSVVGPMNSGIVVWRHQNLDSAAQLKHDLLNSVQGKELWSRVVKGDSKILAPTPFSPWR